MRSPDNLVWTVVFECIHSESDRWRSGAFRSDTWRYDRPLHFGAAQLQSFGGNCRGNSLAASVGIVLLFSCLRRNFNSTLAIPNQKISANLAFPRGQWCT